MKKEIQQLKELAPERLSEPEYFTLVEETITTVDHTARETELDEVMDRLMIANEMAPDKDFKEGVKAAVQIVFNRQVELRKAITSTLT